MPTRFRIIRPMRSSLQITSSCPKYRILQGLLTNRARGSRWVRRCEKTAGMAGRGRTVPDQGSRGPGTKTKWDEWIRGNETRRSVRALKPSIQFSQSAHHNNVTGGCSRAHTGIPLHPALCLPTSLTKVAAQHKHHWLVLYRFRVPFKQSP